jgi:hypothetical protein
MMTASRARIARRHVLGGLALAALLLAPALVHPTAANAVSVTLGYTTQGTLVQGNQGGYMTAARVTTSASSYTTITTIYVYVGTVDSAPNNQGQVAIYTDSGGHPGTLIASSASATLLANTWNGISISAPSLSPTTQYWLAYETNAITSTNNAIKDVAHGTTGVATDQRVAEPFGTWPATAPAMTASYNDSLSIYGQGTRSLAPIGSWYGYNHVGATLESGNGNLANGAVIVPAASFSVINMSVYVGAVDSAPNNKFQFAIYTDTGTAPGTLVASSATGTLTANSWNTLPITASLGASRYWLMYNTNSTTANNPYFDSDVSTERATFSQTFGSFAATAPAATLSRNAMSIIASTTPTCSGGSLGLSSPPTVSFGSLTLNGQNQTMTANATLTPDDETGSGAGWNLTAWATPFQDGSGNTLRAPTVTAASATAGTGACSLPTNQVTYPTAALGSSAGTATKIYNAAANSGAGPANVSITASDAVPANQLIGAGPDTFSSTWTFSLASGP